MAHADGAGHFHAARFQQGTQPAGGIVRGIVDPDAIAPRRARRDRASQPQFVSVRRAVEGQRPRTSFQSHGFVAQAIIGQRRLRRLPAGRALDHQLQRVVVQRERGDTGAGSVTWLFQLMPVLQRSSGNQRSSPITSRTLRVRAATASANVARQSSAQSGAEDRRASPCP
jgi:hypothetical protein